MGAWWMLIAMQVAAVDVAANRDQSEVVVTGKRLDDAYKACEQRQCATSRDAAVSIAMAERFFSEGRYQKARIVLDKALGRTRRHASSDPKSVAALYDAYSTVTVHNGEMDAFAKASGARFRTLDRHAQRGDPDRGMAGLSLAQSWSKRGLPRDADRQYQQTERDARASDQRQVALAAALYRIGLVNARRDYSRAGRMLAALKADLGAGTPSDRAVIDAMQISLLTRPGHDRMSAAAEEAWSKLRTPTAILVWAPPYRQDANTAAERSPFTQLTEPDPVSGVEQPGLIWGDVRFRVGPDGRAGNIEVVRGSLSSGWVKSITEQIAARRYTQSDEPSDSPDRRRMERFSLRTIYGQQIGSHIRRRLGLRAVEAMPLPVDHDPISGGASPTALAAWP